MATVAEVAAATDAGAWLAAACVGAAVGAVVGAAVAAAPLAVQPTAMAPTTMIAAKVFRMVMGAASTKRLISRVLPVVLRVARPPGFDRNPPDRRAARVRAI